MVTGMELGIKWETQSVREPRLTVSTDKMPTVRHLVEAENIGTGHDDTISFL
jgi:hypothetical protein